MKLLFVLLEAIACRLSPQMTRRAGGFLGGICWHLLRLRRGVVERNISDALACDRAERLRLARAAYSHLGRVVLEFLQLRRLGPARARALLGEDNIRKVESILAEGRGALVLSAHLGNWDLLACSAALCGFPVNVITRRIKNGALDRYWMSTRSRCGVRLLSAAGSARSVMRALKRNEVVVVVLDQHAPGGAITPFFGRPAATSLSLARLARASGAPVVPVFLPRTDRGYAATVMQAARLVASGDKARDLLRATVRYTALIEEMVRRYPTQWFWFHRRWKVPIDQAAVQGDQAAELT